MKQFDEAARDIVAELQPFILKWDDVNAIEPQKYITNLIHSYFAEIEAVYTQLRQERAELQKRVEKLEKLIPPQGESILRELFAQAGVDVKFVDATPVEREHKKGRE